MGAMATQPITAVFQAMLLASRPMAGVDPLKHSACELMKAGAKALMPLTLHGAKNPKRKRCVKTPVAQGKSAFAAGGIECRR